MLDERNGITTDSKDLKRIIREYDFKKSLIPTDFPILVK